MTVHTPVSSVMIVTPSHDGKLSASYVSSLLGTLGELSARGMGASWHVSAGGLLPVARNLLAARALAVPGWSHLLMIDADIEWRPEDVLRLLAHDLPMVTGVYPLKVESETISYTPLPSAAPNPKTGLLELDAAGCGFMLLKREVLTRLIEAYPKDRITRAAGLYSSHDSDAISPWLFNFFPLESRGGLFEAEDIAFCRRWREIGGRIWADLHVHPERHASHSFMVDTMSMFGETSALPS